MIIYLEHACRKSSLAAQAKAGHRTTADLMPPSCHGAVERVRPKMMTVVADHGWPVGPSCGYGHRLEVMRRIAAPMVGGMVSSARADTAGDPVIYALVQQRRISSPDQSAAHCARNVVGTCFLWANIALDYG